MATLVTDPDLIRRVREAAGQRQGAQPAQTAPPPSGRVVSDPGVIQAVKNRARLQDAAKKRALEVGQNMPAAPDRISQAFDVASDPIADQSLRPAYDPYTFSENVSRSLPFGDELGSAVAAVGPYMSGKSGFGEAYNKQRILDRAEQERYARQHPAANVGGQILGIAATGAPTGAAAAFGTLRETPAAIAAARAGAKPAGAFFNPAAQGARAIPATVAGRAGEGIVQGGTLGALYGASEGEGLKDRAINAATGAAVGAGAGAALPYLGAVARPLRRLRNAYDPEIGGHVKRLDQEADALYKQMDATGVQVTPSAFQRMAGNVRAKALAEGINPRAHPKAVDLLEGIQAEASGKGGPYLNQQPTFRRMDQIRRDLRDSGTDPTDKRMLRIMMDSWDEQMNRLSPRDLARGRGSPGDALGYLKEGRRLKKQYFKAETVDNLIENAKDKLGANYTQAGLQTGIRQEFRALNKKIRTNKMEKGRWSNEERRLINLIVRGGTGENMMRWVGKLAVRGPVSGSASGLTAYFVNPYLGAAMAGGGELAKRTSTARGIMNAEALDRLIGTGSSKAPPRQLGPVSRGAGQARRILVKGAGAGAGRYGLGDRLITGD